MHFLSQPLSPRLPTKERSQHPDFILFHQTDYIKQIFAFIIYSLLRRGGRGPSVRGYNGYIHMHSIELCLELRTGRI